MFPSSTKREIRDFHVLGLVQRRQRNVQKRVMHVQSYCFVLKTYCFFAVPVADAVVDADGGGTGGREPERIGGGGRLREAGEEIDEKWKGIAQQCLIFSNQERSKRRTPKRKGSGKGCWRGKVWTTLPPTIDNLITMITCLTVPQCVSRFLYSL